MGTARSFAEAAVRLADEVDPGLLEDLAEAVSDDPAREHAMVAAVVRPDDAEFCRAVLRARCSEGRGVLESAAYLRGVAAAYRHRTRTESVEAVWSGPHLHEVPLRSTAAVLVDVVRRARGTLWLTTYSAGAYPPLREALVDGRTRGVRVRVLVETLQGAGSALNGDQPGKAFLGIPGPELWQWPVDRRPDRSTRMHAKIVLADAREMLVSSANLTAAGADRNLEAGILVRGGPPRAAPPSTWTASRQARTSGRCSWAPGERAHDRLGRHGARLAGVGRAAVSNWRRRFGDFPQPVGGSAASPLYRLADVERRLRDHGRTAEISPLDRVWQRMRSGVDDHRLGEVVGDHPGGGLSARHRARRGPRADSAGSGLWHRRSARGAIEGGASEVWGIDVDEAAARISAGRVLTERANGGVARADSLRADPWPGRRFGAVLCEPPFGDRDWGYEELAADPRWELGLPPRGEPELAWLQHCLAHAEPRAAVVLVLPSSAAVRRAGRRIRSTLVRSGALRMVATLSDDVGRALDLWLLRKPAAGEQAPDVLFLSVGIDEIRSRWRAFAADPASADAPGSRRVAPLELLDDDVDLSPARHVPPTDVPVDLDALAAAVDTASRFRRIVLAASSASCSCAVDAIRSTATRRSDMSSRDDPTTATASGWIASGSFSRTSLSARPVCAVTRIRLPWASKWVMRTAAVWVLPVPGGPWMRVCAVLSTRRRIWSCRSLTGSGRNGSSSTRTTAPPACSPSAVPAGSWSASTRGRMPSGTSPASRSCSTMRRKISSSPSANAGGAGGQARTR